ncbi:MAG TPA: DUF5666 domain-containing protein [Bryobacteraceae bacterium]|nr:DUF5666 domain-containing protein [Bryobacteraceae bacterium]
MKRFVALFVGTLLTLLLASHATAQEPGQAPGKAEAKKKIAGDRLSGRIQMINKDTSTITLARGTVKRTVLYSPNTKITYQNKPSTIDEVKEGRRVIVLGKFDEKAQLQATRIEIRE